MVTFDGYDVELSRGDTLVMKIELDGRDLPEGTDGVFTIKKRITSDEVVLQKRFNASDEELTVVLDADETNLAPGTYFWDVRLQIPMEEGGYEVYTPMEYAAFVVLPVVGVDIGTDGDPGMNPDLPVLQVVIAEARKAADAANAAARAVAEAGPAAVKEALSIGNNGNWFIGGVDTGVPATGPKGEGVAYSDEMPAAPGEAAPGTLNRAARGDHVHPLPTPGQLNALPADGTAKNASLLGGKPPEDYLSADGTAKNASLLGGKAPEYYLTPSNLLVNSNFTKVVNRRGITKTTAWQECIDRYIARMSNTLLSFDDDGMTIRSEENTSGFIYQKVADYERLLGKTVTYAAKLNGEILTKIYNIPATLPSSWTDFGSVNKNNHTISAFSSDGTNLSFSIGFENGASTKAEWAALYEGAYTADTLPPYVPKGYANELLACEVAAKGSIISRDLLWQNASPASEFAAQKISIDLSAYSRVGIDFRYNNDEDGFCYGEFGVGVNGFVNPKQVTLTADIMYIVGRGGYARTTGVEFQDCYRYPSYNTMGTNELKNQLLVPWRIYGIKGVLV